MEEKKTEIQLELLQTGVVYFIEQKNARACFGICREVNIISQYAAFDQVFVDELSLRPEKSILVYINPMQDFDEYSNNDFIPERRFYFFKGPHTGIVFRTTAIVFQKMHKTKVKRLCR